MTVDAYTSIFDRRDEILRRSVGIDYEQYRRGILAWDYEALMGTVVYSVDEAARIQRERGVGGTPMQEARNLTALMREVSAPGHGARIFVKDEAANPSGSFKDRRASLSIFEARQRGYGGVIAATSGNYGAAVASQAARAGLRCIVVQEAFDGRGVGQPEILEKARSCEEFGAEVVQCSVGPELFYMLLQLLDTTGYFNASLYTPYSVAGIETLGVEVAEDMRRLTGRPPDVVVATHAGGGNVTGTARGLRKAGAGATNVVAASVDLSGLHMASDGDFNRKSFTTGHSGFSFPFTIRPDRSDVPFNAARPLRYLDRMVLVTQGEVFYATEVLSRLEGMQRGPAGNTSLAAAMVIARELPADATIVVQETEYTGAGKHPWAQLEFAAVANGVQVRNGSSRRERPWPGHRHPDHPRDLGVDDVDIDELRCPISAMLDGLDVAELGDATSRSWPRRSVCRTRSCARRCSARETP
ncbi:MAG: 2-amino-4-oxopentanoate thiolase subunit OrtB [Solirubrobacterales bacterium]